MGPCSLSVVLAGVSAKSSSVPNAAWAERRVERIGRAGCGLWPSEAALVRDELWLVEPVSRAGGAETGSSSFVASSSASSADDALTGGGTRAVGVARSPRARKEILRTRPRARRGGGSALTGTAVAEPLSLAARWCATTGAERSVGTRLCVDSGATDTERPCADVGVGVGAGVTLLLLLVTVSLL